MRTPAGVGTSTSSPSSLPISARPIGEAVEIQPLSPSASSGITSWKVERRAGAFLQHQRRPERGLAVRDAVEIQQRDFADPLPQHGDARVDELLPLLGGLVLGVLTQIAELARAAGSPSAAPS